MERYKGKNAIWLILVFVFYNLLPIGIYFLTDDKENLYNNWWLLIWVFYYSFNIIWIPVLIRNRVEFYDDYFIFYYSFGKEKIFIKDVLKIEKSNNSIASSILQAHHYALPTYRFSCPNKRQHLLINGSSGISCQFLS